METIKKTYPLLALMVLMGLTLSSCDVIMGIFEAGMWVGVVVVVAIVALLFWIIRKLGGRG